tara:strand:+ start:2941 stop:3618 length:678 start_codon:yes stop_codon:yes gene_type:complete
MTLKSNEKWLNVSGIRFFPSIDIIKFHDHIIAYSLLDRTYDSLILTENIAPDHYENISQCNYEIVNANRIRLFRKANGHKVIMETKESTSYETILEQDYVKLLPTISKISENRIQLMKYNFVWNNEKQVIEFNRILNAPVNAGIQESYKEDTMKSLQEDIKNLKDEFRFEGMKILLEKLDQTLFVSFFNNNQRGLVMPIKEIDEDKIVLYGLPKEPFEIIAERIW